MKINPKKKMIRKWLFVTPEQREWLLSIEAARKVTVSAIIRGLVAREMYLAKEYDNYCVVCSLGVAKEDAVEFGEDLAHVWCDD